MSSDAAPTKYRRRHRWPVIVVMVVLLGIGTAVWAQALKPAPAAAAGCNQPITLPTTSSSSSTSGTPTTSGSAGTSGKSAQSFQAPSTSAAPATRSPGKSSSGKSSSRPTTSARTTTGAPTSTTLSTIGQFTDPNILAEIRPANPAQVPLRVLNASTVVGQAKTVTDELRAAGFASILPQDNDPLYPAAQYANAGLNCYGEIRFGYAGQAEARTVLMVAPCAQLVLDGRLDNSVDLSLGARYALTPVSDAVKAQLTAIRNASVPPAVIEGQTQAPKPLPPIPDLPSRAGCPS